MINKPQNPLSAISYTNKDFRAIFEELLDLTKKLTYKWDPSISNESDPGVILLKLNAIIGDKNNYNIDKNVLENFPETVTQEVSARNMYKQLAYQMPWYKSAKVRVTFKWSGETLQLTDPPVTIPRFTMITDRETSVIYTLIEDVVFDYENTVVTVNAMQGIITDLSVNGDKVFKLNALDHNNRIYLDDYTVAENGIFISNAEESDKGYWEKVDNLQVLPLDNKYYEFGIDSRTNATYVEFPTDIETLIRAGLNIKYLISDGYKGNVSSKQLIKFYDDVTIKFRGEDLKIDGEIVQFYNPEASTGGRNPESIIEAYRSYRKVAGTFDTLITLRDYINAIYQSGLVSNDVVSDRLTDIQSSYKIITDNIGSSDSIIEYAKDSQTNSLDMSPYDLKLYLLRTVSVIDNLAAYNDSFELEPNTKDYTSTNVELVKTYIQNTRSMQHNFQPLKAFEPCLYRNVYPIRIKFVPQYQLNTEQINDVKRNIIQALYDNLNSREIEFGEEPDYNIIHDIIVNSDERIKIITIDDFIYTTYATYWDSNENRFKHIPVSNYNDPYIVYRDNYEDFASVIKDLDNPSNFTFICKKRVGNNTIDVAYKYTRETNLQEYSTYIQQFREDIITKAILAGVTPLYKQENSFVYSIDQSFDHIDKDVNRVSTDLLISPWGFEKDSAGKYTDKPKNFTSKDDNIREYTLKENESLQFLAPSFITEMNYSNYVLFEMVKGSETNPQYEHRFASVGEFDIENYSYKGKKIKLYTANIDGTYSVFIDLTIPDLNSSAGAQMSVNEFMTKKFTIDGHEASSAYIAWQKGWLTLYSEEPVYQIASGEEYKLRKNDYVTFFYRETNDDDAPYIYRKYTGIENETETQKSPIIRPTFTINASGAQDAIIKPNSLADSGKIPYNASPYSTFGKIQSMRGDNTLSGTKAIDIRNLNQVTLKKNETYYYFITNDIERNTTKDLYKMQFSEAQPSFEPGKYYEKKGSSYEVLNTKPNNWGVTSGLYFNKVSDNLYTEIQFTFNYTLKADEYFLYTNKNITQYEMLGSGTLIRLLGNPDTSSAPLLTVEAVDQSKVAMDGITAFVDYLKLVIVDTLVREQQIYNLTGGDRIRVELKDNYKRSTYPYFKTNESIVCNDFDVYYSSGSSELNKLPDINIQDIEANWSGTAILNLDASYDDAQIIDNTIKNDDLSKKQSIQQIYLKVATDEDGEVTEIKYPIDPINELESMYLLSNITLSKVGGTNIDVSYLNAFGERTNISLYAYYKNEAFHTEPFEWSPEFGIRYKFMQKYKTFTINNIKLEKGYNYILGVRNTSQNIKIQLQTKYTGSTTYSNIYCLNGVAKDGVSDPITGWYGLGKYYYLIENIDGKFNNLRFNVSEAKDEDAYIMLDNLTKCVPNDTFDKYNIESTVIEDKIKQFDYNGYFKYNYIVPSSLLIDDPLEGIKFFEERHPCNKYTIGKAALLMSDTVNNSSNVVIINNR